jgi:hypothetical protein
VTIVRMQDGEFVRHYLARLGRVNDGTSDQQLRARLRRLLGLAEDDTATTLVELIAQANRKAVAEVLRENSLVPFTFHTAPATTGQSGDRWYVPIVRTRGLTFRKHWMALCQRCVQRDLERGFSYWRRNHQLPGEIVCSTHEQPLVRIEDAPDFGLTPSEALDRSSKLIYDCGQDHFKATTQVSRYLEFAHYFMQQRCPIPQETYISAVGQRAAELGYCRDPRWPTGKFISDDVLGLYPAAWLSGALPVTRAKTRGTYFRPIDTAIGSRAGAKTEAHCLVLPLLFGSLAGFLSALGADEPSNKKKVR